MFCHVFSGGAWIKNRAVHGDIHAWREQYAVGAGDRQRVYGEHCAERGLHRDRRGWRRGCRRNERHRLFQHDNGRGALHRAISEQYGGGVEGDARTDECIPDAHYTIEMLDKIDEQQNDTLITQHLFTVKLGRNEYIQNRRLA